MNKIGLIIKREYLTRVKKKSFIIMTIVGPLLIAAFGVIAILIATADTTTYDVLVSDKDGLISAYSKESGELECRFPRNFKNTSKVKYTFSREVLSKEELETSPFNLSLEIDNELLEGREARLLYKSPPSTIVKGQLERNLEKSLEEKRVQDNLNIDFEEYQNLKVGIRLIEMDINKMGETKSVEANGVVGFIFSLGIYLFIFIYGVMVMRGVIEEKTNRIIEVIVSSVKPFQLMLGKIVGIGLVGVTQLLLWVVMISTFNAVAMPMIAKRLADSPTEIMQNGNMVEVPESKEVLEGFMVFSDMLADIPFGMLAIVFICCFIGGYVLYGAIFAAIGAIVDSETDTQQFMLPVTIPLVLGYLISVLMISNPSGPAGYWGSFIPFTSPTVLLVRTAIEGSTIWLQVVLSLVLLFGTALAIVWLSGKIYRTGILMYGKKVSYKEVIKWIKYS